MAGDSLGGLLIKISGDMSEVKTAMDKTTYLVEQSYNQMTKAGDKLIGSFKAIAAAAGIGFSVVALKGMAEQAIKAADALDDLTEKVGGSASAWSGLIDSARIAGIGFETIEQGAVRLSRAMSGSEVETKGSTKAFEFLGVSVRDASGNMRATEQVMVDVARALDKYQDGAGKAAIAQDIFGKGGAALLPALKQIAQDGARVGSVTDDMAKSADAYGKDLVRLAIAKESLARIITFQMLPAANAVVTVMTDMAARTDSASSAAKTMGADGTLAEWAWNTAKAVAILTDGLKTFVGFAGQAGNVSKIFGDQAIEGLPFGEQLKSLLQMTDAGKDWNKQIVEAKANYKAFLESTSKSMLDLIRLQQQATEALKLTGAQYLDARDLRANPALKPSAGGYTSGAGAGRTAKDEADKWLAEQKRLRELDAKGWVAYIEDMEKRDVEALKENERRWDAHWKKMDQMRDADLKGAIDAFDSMIAESEELMRALGAMAPSMTQLYTTAKQSLDQWLAQVKQEASLIGLTSTQREKAILLAERELALKQIEIAIHPDLIAKVNALYEARARLLDMRDAQAELAGMTSSLTDALLSAFENGKSGVKAFLDWIKAEFLKTVLRPQIQAFLTPVASAVQSVFGGLSTSLSGSGGLISAFSSFFGGGGVSGYGGAGDPGGFSPADRSLSNNSLAGLFERYFGQGGNVTTALSGIVLGLGVGGAIASALGHGDTHKDATAILSVVGAIVDLYFGGSGMIGGAIGGAVGGIFDAMNEGDIERTARVGQGPGNYTYGSTGGPFGDIGIQRFSDKGFSDTEMGLTLRSWFQAIGKLDQEVARHFSADKISRATAALSGQGMAVNFGLEHTSLDPETLSNIIRTRFGTIFGVIDSQMAALVTNFKGSGEELITLVVDLATVHDRLTALHAEFSTLFGEDISFAQLADLKGETEGYSEALQRLAGEYAVTNQIAQMLGKTQEEVWGAIGLASEGARKKLIDLAGGLDALSEQLDFYYSHFYTTAEQQAQTFNGLSTVFADMGVAMPMTLDDFRDLTDSYLAQGEAGAEAAAKLLAVAPAFYAYIGAIEAVNATLEGNSGSLAAIFGRVITLEDVKKFQRNGEALTATLARITSEFNATNSMLSMFGLTGEEVFGAFGEASEEMRAKVIALAGGMDAFTGKLNSFYQHYFSQSERNAMNVSAWTAQFAQWGITLPTTTSGLRDLYQEWLPLIGLDGPMGDTARAVIAYILDIEGSFYDMFSSVSEGAAETARRVVRGPAVDDLGRAAAVAHENLVRLNETLRNSFQDAYRSIEMDGLTDQEKYRYLQLEAAGYTVNLQSAGTGEEVQKWAQKIKDDMLAAYNLLDPAERALRKQEFLDNLLKIETMATARLTALDPTGSLSRGFGEPAVAAAEAQSNAASTQREAAIMQKQAAADMQEAAKAMILAQQLIKRIQIDLPNQGVTVEAGA